MFVKLVKENKIFSFGVIKDKDYETMFCTLKTLHIFITPISSEEYWKLKKKLESNETLPDRDEFYAFEDTLDKERKDEK